MASYFGEVIHPVSRAFWNDEDDDEVLENTQDNVEFIVDWIEPEPSEFERFFVVEGEMVIDFVTKGLLEDVRPVCTIEYNSDKNCTKIYSLNKGIYICTISTKLNIVQAGQLTETIAPLLSKSKHLYTLTSDHISRFKCEEEITSASFLKALYSSKSRNCKNIGTSILNQPNIVTGVCAGVLSHAEIANLSCIMYILYTDTFILDSKNALPLVELFSELLGKVPNFTAADSSFFNKGNLYIQQLIENARRMTGKIVLNRRVNNL